MDTFEDPKTSWDLHAAEMEAEAPEPIGIKQPNVDYWIERALRAELDRARQELEVLRLKRKLVAVELDLQIQKQIDMVSFAQRELDALRRK